MIEEVIETKERNPVDVYRNVVSLYGILQGRRHHLRIRRAALNLRGEVKAEPIDFIADVELKAKRILEPVEFEMFQRLVLQGEPELLPPGLQRDLGEIWNRYGLNFDGPYSSLFFQVKNEQKVQDVTEDNNESNG